MRTDLTDITLVLDRSGSMDVIRTDTIGGVNTFIQEQQKAPGEACFSLVQFDHEYEPQYQGKGMKDVPLLTEQTFIPRGMTALLDAIGRTIVTTGQRFAGMPEDQRPGKVVFVIMTDGQENHSIEYKDTTRIREMITHQQERYGWQFVFLGANQDAITVAHGMGIPQSNAMSYAANAKGTQDAFWSVSHNTVRYRSGGQSVGFSDEDRQAQQDAGV